MPHVPARWSARGAFQSAEHGIEFRRDLPARAVVEELVSIGIIFDKVVEIVPEWSEVGADLVHDVDTERPFEGYWRDRLIRQVDVASEVLRVLPDQLLHGLPNGPERGLAERIARRERTVGVAVHGALAGPCWE